MEWNKTVSILITMAFTAAIGVLLLFIGCAIRFPGTAGYLEVNWWGIFTLLFYLASPIPLAIARCCKSRDVISSESLSVLFDTCYFVSALIVVSGFGLPFVLARHGVIQPAAGGLIAGANVFAFGTIYSYFVFFGHEDEWDWTSGNF